MSAPIDKATLDQLIDRIVEQVMARPVPPLLYHYTGWPGLEGILRQQRIWATAHDCTNDPGELTSAHDVITDVAEQMLTDTNSDTVGQALSVFLRSYESMSVDKALGVYLACFSLASDIPKLWRNYATACQGICIGLRAGLSEPAPTNPKLAIFVTDVTYDEGAWRDRIRDAFEKVCHLLIGAEPGAESVAQGAAAFHRIAGIAAISAKKTLWAEEREFRVVALAKLDDRPTECQVNEKRYVELKVRKDKPMWLAEVIVGSEQAAEAARERVASILRETGYAAEGPEYPAILVSQVRCRT